MADPHQNFIDNHFNQPRRTAGRGASGASGASPERQFPIRDRRAIPGVEYWSEKEEALAAMDTTAAGKARWQAYLNQRSSDKPKVGDSSPLPPRKKTK